MAMGKTVGRSGECTLGFNQGDTGEKLHRTAQD